MNDYLYALPNPVKSHSNLLKRPEGDWKLLPYIATQNNYHYLEDQKHTNLFPKIQIFFFDYNIKSNFK